ncbi:hypothetical protein [Actinoplanes sp. URMC 104]|uniref:hypothetical protein n=1 Tax=Actinoplanes sp. URMC 104 TaxID=3423409 RepID=UPI003F19887A
MERGEVWWARIDEERPVVLLSGGAGPEYRAVQIVEPAAPAQKVGFLLMSGEQAADPGVRRRILAGDGPGVLAVGIEVFLGAEEGLAATGVVRVALPRDGRIFCTWGATLDEACLVRRLGALSAAKQHELDVALTLAGGQ